MGLFSSNFGNNFTYFYVVPPISSKTTSSDLCVNDKTSTNLCVNDKTTSDLCVNEKTTSDLCI